MNAVVGERRSLVMSLLAVLLIAELIAGSVLARAIAGAKSQPWPLSVAIIGDQYTAGFENRNVWPTLLAERTGWSVSNFALPDAGFVADGRGGHGFSYQADRAKAANPQVVVIVGGIADSPYPDLGQVDVGALETVNKLKMGDARVLIVGPIGYESPPPQSVRRVADAVQQAAEETGVPYLNALDPPWLTKEQMRADLKGPNDEGQSVIADKIAAWLRTEVAQ